MATNNNNEGGKKRRRGVVRTTWRGVRSALAFLFCLPCIAPKKVPAKRSKRPRRGEVVPENVPKTTTAAAVASVRIEAPTAEAGCEGPKAGCQKPEVGCQKPEAGCQGPKAGCQEPKAGCQGPKAGCQGPKAGCQKPEAGIQPMVDVLKFQEEPKAGCQKPEVGYQKPMVDVLKFQEKPKAGCQKPEAGIQKPMVDVLKFQEEDSIKALVDELVLEVCRLNAVPVKKSAPQSIELQANSLLAQPLIDPVHCQVAVPVRQEKALEKKAIADVDYLGLAGLIVHDAINGAMKMLQEEKIVSEARGGGGDVFEIVTKNSDDGEKFILDMNCMLLCHTAKFEATKDLLQESVECSLQQEL